MKKIFLCLALLLLSGPVLRAMQWGTSPPATAAVGANSGTVAATIAAANIGTATSFYLWVQDPNLVWHQVTGSAGVFSAPVTVSSSYTFSNGPGAYVWYANSNVGAPPPTPPGGTIVCGPTTTQVGIPITAATISSLNYNGTPQSPSSVTSMTPAGAMGSVTVGAPAQTNANTYNTGTVTGTGNYYGTLSGLSWTINKINANTPTVGASANPGTTGNPTTFTPGNGTTNLYGWTINGTQVSTYNGSAWSVTSGSYASGSWSISGLNLVVTPTTTASYTVIFTDLGNGNYNAVNSATLTETVNPANTLPVITTQPAASQTVTAGQAASFTVVATGVPAPTYQWNKAGVAISGATSATYTIAATAASDAATYTVTVTNSVGSVTSTNAVLTVNTLPAITTQPAASQTVTAGQAASFTVVATGIPTPTYQWKKGGAVISGATSTTYTIAATAASDAATYTVTVTNSAGSVTSTNAVLTVNAANTLPVITTQPAASQTVAAGQAASFTVVATGVPAPTYQWNKAGVAISGATSATYTIAATAASDAATYTVTVTNSVGSVTSTNAVLTVNTLPAITTQPAASQTVTAGQAASFTVVATGIPTPTYQWKKGGAVISGATSTTYTIAATAASDAATYTVTVTNSVGSVTSTNAVLTVNAANTLPAITTQPAASQTVTAGQAASFTVVATGVPAPTYQWNKAGVAISGATSATYTIAATAASDAATYTVTVTNSVGSVTSTNAVLTVNTLPAITTQPAASQTVTAGQAASFTVVATGIPTPTYQWKKGGAVISGATSTTYTIAATAASDAATYTVTVTNSVGSVTSTNAVLTVNAANTLPAITTQPAASQTVTAGQAASFTVVATGVPAPTYQWNKAGVAISGATSATYTIAATAASDAATYTVTVTNSVGSVTSTNAVLTVNPVGYNGTPDIVWWKGNVGSGTTDPDSSTGSAGTLTLSSSAIWGTTFTQGGSTSDFVFNGTSYSAASTSPINYGGNSKITVEFRLKQSSYSTATTQRYLESSPNSANNANFWCIYNDSDSNSGAIMLFFSDGAGIGCYYMIARPSVGSWHHIAVIFDNSANNAPLAWIDGSSVAVTVAYNGWTSAGAFSTQTLYVGARASNSLWAPASMKDIRIWAGARTASNITTDATDYPAPPNTVPVITTQPVSQTVTAGTSVTFTAAASGTPTPTYQWKKGGVNVAGATSASYTIASPVAGDAGTYTVVATNVAGSATSNGAVLTVNIAPAITTQPTSQTVTAGASVTFTAAASGTPAPTYQWQKNGTNIPGATSTSYTIASTATGDAGTYRVVATNAAGTATSNGAVLTVNSANAAPTITTQPASQTVTAGGNVTFTAVASGVPTPTYQWKKNGSSIAGATNSTYTIAATVAGDAATYTVTITNSSGTVTSNGAVLTINLASLPYMTDFETGDSYVAGTLDRQLGWTVSQGSAVVTTADHFAGTQSVQLSSGSSSAVITQNFANSGGETIEYFDFFAKPVAETSLASATTFTVEGARFAFLLNGSQGILQAFSGNGTGGGTWQPTAFAIPVNASHQAQSWVRLSARLDFTGHKWDLYAGGTMVAADVPFINSASTYLSSFQVQGDTAAASGVDGILAGPSNPLFADTNNNGIDDAWETAHGLSLANPNRNTSPTNNGITVIQAYVAGTNPNDFYNGSAPTLIMLGGNNQVGISGKFNVLPFDMGVYNSSGATALINAPVTFTVQSGGGKLALTNIGTPALSTTLSLNTDNLGTAIVYYQQPAGNGVQSNVLFAAGTAQATFLTSSAVDTDGDGIPDAWEIAYGLDPNNPADAAYLSAAAIGSGKTNLQAYQTGLYPLVLDLQNALMPVPPTGTYQLILLAPGNNIYGVKNDWQINPLPVPVN